MLWNVAESSNAGSKRGEEMKKTFAFLNLAIVFCLVLSAGCGMDTTRARNLMKQADEAWQKASVGIESAVEANAMLVATAMSGEPQRVQPEKFSGMTERMDVLIDQLKGVAGKYEKMSELAGIEDYVRYALMMKKAVNAHIGFVKLIKAFFENLQPFFLRGDVVGLVNEINRADKEFKQIKDERDKAANLLKEAARYKKEKNLSD